MTSTTVHLFALLPFLKWDLNFQVVFSPPESRVPSRRPPTGEPGMIRHLPCSAPLRLNSRFTDGSFLSSLEASGLSELAVSYEAGRPSVSLQPYFNTGGTARMFPSPNGPPLPEGTGSWGRNPRRRHPLPSPAQGANLSYVPGKHGRLHGRAVGLAVDASGL